MDNDVIDLHAQSVVLRRRWRVIVLMTLLGLGAAYALAYAETPTYIARAEVLVDPLTSQTPANGVLVQPEEVSTQLQVLGSVPVANLVIKELGLPDTPSQLLKTVTVISVDDTRVLSVEATRTSAEDAAAIANAFGEHYLDFRKSGAVAQAEAGRQAISEQFSTIEDLLSAIDEQLETATGSEEAALQAQRQGLLIQLSQLSSELSALNTSGTGTLEGGQILRPADVPANQAAPRPIRMALLGAIVGFMLGVGLAYVRDRYDDAVRDERRLEEALAGRPILGHIPHWSGSRSGRIVTLIEPHSATSEAYRALSTNVRFLLAAAVANQPGRPANRTLLVSSAGPGEGKTSVAANLAVAACGVGLKVILVDADLRQPRLSHLFGLGDSPGLSDVLAGGDSARDHLIDVGVDNLRVLPGGSAPPNPAELLASPAAKALIRELRKDCDLLIFDSAPILRVADSLELVAEAGVVLLVARNGQSRLRNLTATVARVKQVGGEVAGAVFNDIAPRTSGFTQGYGAPPVKPDKAGDKQSSKPPRSSRKDSSRHEIDQAARDSDDDRRVMPKSRR